MLVPSFPIFLWFPISLDLRRVQEHMERLDFQVGNILSFVPFVTLLARNIWGFLEEEAWL